ncbi:hypothetical protein [Flavobacterium hungaricum]|uniref:50S ribosomal protein L5 n=1 Tax=Flavobacterium hungaricum TaxID=2082725 RepID=A0ABR9THV3_9FLAO|nr:hypothetical protein [Flavobacterium hungaricum]MBE8724252.1 hypothetical protein [Flavobacterium hungaricum]
MKNAIKLIFGLLFIGMFSLYIIYFSSFVMPWERNEAIQSALEWGKLDTLPQDAEIISLEKRGSIFTRQFIIEFESSESEIKKWMMRSQGFKNNTPEIRNEKKIYHIHIKKSKAYGGKVEITGNKVLINMSWS